MAEGCPITIEPFAESGIIKTPKIVNLNYTNQDFWSMKARLIDFINERFGPEGSVVPNTFSDLVESDIAIMLIENWAFLADTLSFKIDQMVNEMFIDTVTEVENAFRLSKLVGFKPQPPISARTMWLATLQSPQITDIVLPTPILIDVVSEGEGMVIELFPADAANNPILDEDIIMPAGSTENRSIIGLEGQTFTQVATGTGEVGQTVQLTSSPVIYDSIRVEVDGVQWEEIEYFSDSQPRREYRVEFDSSYNAYVIFGNNRAGLIPSSGSSISIKYRVGGGIRGNIVSGFVETQRQTPVPGLAFQVPVTFRNITRGEYGYDGDTIEDVRRKLPRYLRTQNRAVTGTDYKTLTDQFSTAYHGQVGKSTAVLRNHGCAGNIIDLYILALDDTDDLSSASNELKVDLIEELNSKKMMTDFICVRDGTVILVDVSIEVTMDKFYRKFEQEIKARINNRIDQFFKLTNWEYNKDLKDSDIIKVLSPIDQVQSFEIELQTDDEDNSGSIVTTQFDEIIRPDNITVTFMYT